MKIKKGEVFVTTSFVVVLLVYLSSIFYVNLIGEPSFYVTDMYSDMNYAVEVWKQKNVFPEDWVFGNQLYVVATPVVSSLFYGLTQNPCLSMGLASSFMTLLTIISFNWMLKPVQKSRTTRLISITTFLSLTLFCGGCVYRLNGWQLFFTMCSYYSCYAITTFLILGCYLRSDNICNFRTVIMLIVSFFMSFATGVQSLRQTAVMVCPLIFLEFLKFLYNVVHKEKIITKSALISAGFVASNLLGVLVAKIIDVKQNQIFGTIQLNSFSELLPSFGKSLKNAVSLLFSDNSVFSLILIIALLSFLFLLVFKLKAKLNAEILICIIFFMTSFLCVFIIDVFTTMKIRNIYYFLIFPFVSLAIGLLYSFFTNKTKYLIAVSLLMLFVFNTATQLLPLNNVRNNDDTYVQVSDYLTENNITTIYSKWNLGEKISIASDWKISAGFWSSDGKAFQSVKYLCNPDIFDRSPEHCAYIFKGKKSVDTALEIVREHNVDFSLAKYFEKSDIYIFVSQDPLMKELDNISVAQ